MSYTEIYGFDKKGNSFLLGEVHNSWRGAMAIWTILEEKYLPPFDPYGYGNITRMALFSDKKKSQEVWDLWKDDRLKEYEKITMMSTFDRVVIKKENINKLIDAFYNFDNDNKERTTLLKQIEIIRENKNIIAIAWNQTSVNSNPWEIYYQKINKKDIKKLKKNNYEFIDDTEDLLDEGYKPYNLFKNKDHWFLFDELENFKKEKN